jgi:hypothetical protein
LVELDSSRAGNDISNSDVKGGDETIDKCPVCFMIFPKNMGKQDREKHANEHYLDD